MAAATYPVRASDDRRLSWLHAFSALILAFLIAPILVLVLLSFNAEPYFSFTKGMLELDAGAWSLRWYRELVNDPQWASSFWNSLLIAAVATPIATVLGTVAAFGLSRPGLPLKNAIMVVLVAPMIVPLIITATGMYFFFSAIDLTQNFAGVILAEVALASPYVVVTVAAVLAGFDYNLVKAALSLGSPPVRTFFKIVVPLIAPGIGSGALFAFISIFDEVVVVRFLAGPGQRTVPLQMWSGIQEELSPTILAAATLFVMLATTVLCSLEWMRRHAAQLSGPKPLPNG